MRLLIIFGTRPEAIKLAPLVHRLRAAPGVHVHTCVTGQHKLLLHLGMAAFDLTPDTDLNLMRPSQSPSALVGRIMAALEAVIVQASPDMIVVQGDTSSALAGALAGRLHGVAVAHVEAGLRSGDLSSPFPEEGNRRLIDQIATLHFAPTPTAAQAMLAEVHPAEGIHTTGNTGVDAVLQVAERVRGTGLGDYPGLASVGASGPLITVTAHRRESFGDGLIGIATALRRIAKRTPQPRIVLPLHPNPAVDGPLRAALMGVQSVHLVAPLPYPAMVRLLMSTQVLLTDSGGLQEEAPSLGLRALVTRARTERLEGLAAGTATLVGTDPKVITEHVLAWLDQPELSRWGGPNPYGDGTATEQIAKVLTGLKGLKGLST